MGEKERKSWGQTEKKTRGERKRETAGEAKRSERKPRVCKLHCEVPLMVM